ncbi:hypothetical protein [Flavobacterium hydrophilum]|uniref:Uncharacterized protein n=1 Tax=Flavobacterium hydrophilum TaxID=2211445 RepID=A0A2V4C7E8_9FLAO|nr:hypothetical protein [Flavobacterium hydrophilum]PXY47005.1 hypothetical protein DMB68_07620 [Flavobacterium hydrophilum]
MSELESIFTAELKNYTGKDKALLAIDEVAFKIKEELPDNFNHWMEHIPVLVPIAKVGVEIDELGYVYTMLINEKGQCMESEAASPCLDDLGLMKLYKKNSELVTQFLAVCYQKVLSEACKSPEFLKLPRAAEIVFSVGEHAGWECEQVYTYKGERYEIDHGNIRLKRLRFATTCYTEPNTPERKFMDHLQDIDIQKCSDELLPVFTEFLIWLSHEKTKPLKKVILAWSSNFFKDVAMGGKDDIVYRWPGTFDLYKWFSSERPQDLDDDGLVSVRYCVSNKIAEIACLTAEKCIELDAFKALPKDDSFIMEVMNRTAGAPPRFYPFT